MTNLSEHLRGVNSQRNEIAKVNLAKRKLQRYNGNYPEDVVSVVASELFGDDLNGGAFHESMERMIIIVRHALRLLDS